MADDPALIPADPCGWCGELIIQPATGRKKRYCKPGCRQRAFEQRRALRSLGLDPSISDGTGRGALDAPPVSGDGG